MQIGKLVRIEEIGSVLGNVWEDSVQRREIWIKLPDGKEGGVVALSPSEFSWLAFDEHGSSIDPVERIDVCGKYLKVWNWLRAQKVGGLKGVRFGRLPAPSGDGFFVSNPDDPRSIMRRPWIGITTSFGRKLSAIPNGFPYVSDGHFLVLVADFEDERAISYPYAPQRLTPELTSDILAIAAAAGPGWAVGDNDIYAGASQARFHLQLFRGEYAVEGFFRAKAEEYSYPLGYPAGCAVIEAADAPRLWHCVNRLQCAATPFNLLVRNRTVYVFARRPGCELVSEFPSGVMAVSELSGRLLISDESMWKTLDELTIRAALAKTTLSVEETLAVLSN